MTNFSQSISVMSVFFTRKTPRRWDSENLDINVSGQAGFCSLIYCKLFSISDVLWGYWDPISFPCTIPLSIPLFTEAHMAGDGRFCSRLNEWTSNYQIVYNPHPRNTRSLLASEIPAVKRCRFCFRVCLRAVRAHDSHLWERILDWP